MNKVIQNNLNAPYAGKHIRVEDNLGNSAIALTSIHEDVT